MSKAVGLNDSVAVIGAGLIGRGWAIDDARLQLLKHEDLSQRQHWRDDRLSALVAHKSKQEN